MVTPYFPCGRRGGVFDDAVVAAAMIDILVPPRRTLAGDFSAPVSAAESAPRCATTGAQSAVDAVQLRSLTPGLMPLP